MKAIQLLLGALAVAGLILPAYAMMPVAKAGNAGAKLTFPLGVATPSEECGACHQAFYREFVQGEGADLQWKPMRLLPTSHDVLGPAANLPTSATAHAVAGVDLWPIEAARVEEGGSHAMSVTTRKPSRTRT